SRRRHTRLVSDWSSDVCSSDLTPPRPAPSSTPPDDPAKYRGVAAAAAGSANPRTGSAVRSGSPLAGYWGSAPCLRWSQGACDRRSEEGRVGERGGERGVRQEHK